MVWVNPYKERIIQTITTDYVNHKYGNLMHSIYHHNARGDFKKFFEMLHQFPNVQQDILHTLIEIVNEIDSQQSQ